MFCLMPRLLRAALAFVAVTPLAYSAVTVEGLEDRSTVTGQVRFRVLEDPAGEWSGKLDGIAVPIGEWIEVATAGYHELYLEPIATASSEPPSLIRFVVRDPVRGSSETGLAPWTPPAPVPAHPEALGCLPAATN